MGQIHGPSLGSPAAIVTSVGELLVTGSVSNASTTADILNTNDVTQLLTEILKEQRIMNIQLESMTGIQINNAEID